MADPRLTGSIGQQRGIRERRRGPLPEDADDGTRRGRLRNGEELPGGGERLVARIQTLDQPVDQGQASTRVPFLTQGSQRDIADVPSQDVWLVRLVNGPLLDVLGGVARQTSFERAGDETLVQPLEQTLVPIAHRGSLPGLSDTLPLRTGVSPT